VIDLAPDIIALLCLAAVAAGFVDAIAGGGGLIVIPALLAAGISPVAALATNKVQACVGTASATYTFWRAGWIDFNLLRVPLVAALAGAALGGLALMVVDTRWLMVVLPILLVGIALYFLLAPVAADTDSQARLTPLGYSAVAASIGFYDGFFGPGTGSMFIIAFHYLLRMDLVSSSANSKTFNFASNIGALVAFVIAGKVVYLLALPLVACNILGNHLGSALALRKGNGVVRKALVFSMLCLFTSLGVKYLA
jgi:uncharacterized membrane protein YfcA